MPLEMRWRRFLGQEAGCVVVGFGCVAENNGLVPLSVLSGSRNNECRMESADLETLSSRTAEAGSLKRTRRRIHRQARETDVK